MPWLIIITLSCSNPNIDSKWGILGEEELSSEGLSKSEDPLDNTGLPSSDSEMDSSYCNEAWAETPNVVGAVSYFSGIYLKEDDSRWIGREEWSLFANENWENLNRQDCAVVWNMTASPTDIETCVSCTMALSVEANIDLNLTTCPEEIWNYPEEKSWSTTYELVLINDQALFYFQNSGNIVGIGHSNDDAASFLSDPSCIWF